jgi:two-component system sensor histidine kinase FlrB
LSGEGHIKLCVEDDGPGIAGELLESVRDVFVTTKAQGTGLGLSVVDSVAQRHGGSFVLDSEVGNGTCACLELPLAQLTQSKICEVGV